MNCVKARKIVKLLGVLLLFACVWLGDVRNVSAAGEITFLAPEGVEEPQVLEEIFVTETIKPMNASSVSGKWGALNWSLNNGVLKITGSGAMEVLDGNYPWKAYTSEVTEVIIGDYVTMTGNNAFEGMSNIKSVTLGSRLDYIAPCTFKYCTALEKIFIPARVTGIDYEAFYYCSALKEVVFAEDSMLKGIGYNVFVYCTELTSITLPAGVEILGSGVFWYCSNLETVKLSNKVNGIYRCAFDSCKKLKSITIPESVAFIQKEAFYHCEEMTSIEIKAKLETIEDKTFSSCFKLEKVVLPEGLKKIGTLAFSNCRSLVSVNIPEGVQEIGDAAFNSCESLKEITVPSTVTKLGHSIFSSCKGLQEAFIYAKCDIPYRMFYECTSLREAVLSEEIIGIGKEAFFNDVALEEIVIPEPVTYIYEYAFWDCNSLSKVKWGSKLTTIGDYAFLSTAITSVTLPDSVTSIGEGVFWGCNELKTAYLGDNITVIPPRAFDGCGALETVTWSDKITKIEREAFVNCVALKDVKWPTALVTIEKEAFKNCRSFVTVMIPNSVKSIGEMAFYGCNQLATYKCYSTDTVYGDSVFDYTPVTIYGLADSTSQTYAKSNQHTFIPITQLDTPVSKKIINVVSGPHIYWNEVPGADYYTIYRADSKNGAYKKLAEKLSIPHYIDTSAVSGKTYFYKLEAGNPHVTSELSLPLGIIYVGTPDITSRVNNAAGIKLGWNKINGATGYAIYRKSYAGNDAWKRVATISGNSTFTWTDEEVKANNGSVYKYTVRALAGSDKKTLSGCRTTGRTMVRLTSRVLNSAEKIGSTSIKCEWTTSSAVTGYEVRFMVWDSVIKTVTIGNYKTGVKTFTGLAKGKKYKVQVRSYKKVDGVGSFYSAWSVAKYVQL